MTTLVALDLCKAFDRVNHRLLIRMLHYTGFSDRSVQFMKSYLQNKQQSVVWKGLISRSLTVNNRVLQGSVRGPLLFAIYTSQFKDSLKYSNSHFYAGNTQTCLSYYHTESMSNSRINQSLVANNYCLTLNPLKSLYSLAHAIENETV